MYRKSTISPALCSLFVAVAAGSVVAETGVGPTGLGQLGVEQTVIEESGNGQNCEMRIEGTLHTDSGTTDRSRMAPSKKTNICALGQCATTDESGKWSMTVHGDFPGGLVMFGVGSEATQSATLVRLPNHPQRVEISFVGHGPGSLEATSVSVDGKQIF